MKRIKLMKGDNLASLKKLPDNSIDSIVSDPPYGLSFMNKKWDYDVPSVEFWQEVYRVLKPGGHVLSFGGTRTYHRMVVNIEDAGFEIRDQIMWLYGSGFPKSHNIGKAVDKLEGNEREWISKSPYGPRKSSKSQSLVHNTMHADKTKGNSPYEGWGTALKPANEPICVARKPLSEKSVAENVLKWGTGGINIDGCRIPSENNEHFRSISEKREKQSYLNSESLIPTNSEEGRFPANLILDEVAAQMLDEQSGVSKSSQRINGRDYNKKSDNINIGGGNKNCEYDDKGGASRFFYIPKVSKKERNMGLDAFEEKTSQLNSGGIGRKTSVEKRLDNNGENAPTSKNVHPTVKPVQLMAYLCRLITPKNGIVLDPYMGSGSTGIAALLEGFRFVGMEMDEDYFKIAEARIENYESYREFVDKKKK